MRKILHLLTQPDDSLAREIITHQSQSGANTVDVVDMRQGEPDYESLLAKIFEADSVQVW